MAVLGGSRFEVLRTRVSAVPDFAQLIQVVSDYVRACMIIFIDLTPDKALCQATNEKYIRLCTSTAGNCGGLICVAHFR